jgi:hypothetical protein
MVYKGAITAPEGTVFPKPPEGTFTRIGRLLSPDK